MQRPISEIAVAIRQKHESLENLAEQLIQRVETLNPQLNAIVRFDPALIRAEVQRVTGLLAENCFLPLLGMTFTVKDNIWVKDVGASQGSNVFKDFIAPENALCVQRLQEKGAMLLGITNSSEFACKGVTTNQVYGSTSNPWDLTCTPGGSSGGAASAVSAGLGSIAIGTDAGGSVRRPASHTGVIGFKPSQGYIPHPIGFKEPVFNHSTIGILGRHTADVRLALEAMGGADPRDVMSAGFHPIPSKGLRGLRVAYSPRLGLGFPVEAEVQAAVQATLHALAAHGCQIEEADPKWPEGLEEAALMPLQFAGLAALYGEQWEKDPTVFDADIAHQIEQGMALSAVSIAKALFFREELNHALVTFQKDYDLLVTPTTPCVAWDKTQLGPEIIEGRAVQSRAHAAFTPIFNHTFVPACSVPCRDLVQGLPVGLQIVGRRYEDELVLDAVEAIEQAFEADWKIGPIR